MARCRYLASREEDLRKRVCQRRLCLRVNLTVHIILVADLYTAYQTFVTSAPNAAKEPNVTEPRDESSDSCSVIVLDAA